jgi:hypothetical protein
LKNFCWSIDLEVSLIFKESEKLFQQREDRLEVENNRLNRKPTDKDDEEMEEDDEDLEVEEVSSDEWDEEDEDAIPPNDCLFCDHHSSNVDKVIMKSSSIQTVHQ